jgi:methylglutaconyl-CoA hydratase
LARVVTPDDLEAAVQAEVTPYLACAPGAVAEAKALLRSLGPRIDTEVIEGTIAALVTRWESAESEEGISAFFEKRDPSWKA